MNPGALDIDKIAKPLASFLIAFAIGVTSFNFGMLAFFLIEQEAKTDSSVLPPTPSVIDEFAPEFTDLPDFREIEYKKPKGKLIEILNDGIYRRSEVVARHRENWLVLTDSGGSFSLVASLASIKALKTVSWPGDEPDARFSFACPVLSTSLLKG